MLGLRDGQWEVRNLPNVLLVHFNDMKSDLEGSIYSIAEFLGVEAVAATFARIVEHCTFDYMKSHAPEMAPRGGVGWKGGADTFIHKGTNGRWRERLTEGDVAAYDERATSEIGTDCARWLVEGGPHS